MHTHAFRLKALHSQKPPNTEPWNFTLDTYNCPTPTRSHSSALSSQRCHTISLLSSLLHRTVCTLPLPLLPLPKNHSEGLKHTFMELPSVHSIYGCMWNVQTILQHREVNRAVSELTVLSCCRIFFCTEAQLVYYKSTKLETGAHMLHAACVGLVFVHNFHQNISSWQHISLLQGEMGKRSFSVSCHNKHMTNMNEHEARKQLTWHTV